MKKERRKGLIIVHTGSGKGKTTAAMGLALRAVGHNLNTLMIQFIKGSWHYGELEAAKRLRPYFNIAPMGKGFLRSRKVPNTEHKRAVIEAWEFFKEKMQSDEFDMIILDEINYALGYRFLPMGEALKAIKAKPDRLHLVLTGRNAHPRIVEIADLVTEMKEINTLFRKGLMHRQALSFEWIKAPGMDLPPYR